MPIITILVEDSKTILDTLIPTLEELANADVIAVAATAQEGVAALHEHDAVWQLVVVDLFLKVGVGFEVLRACAGRRPSQRAVVLSNYCTQEMRERCKAAGADAVFDKSTETEEFLAYCLSLDGR